LSELPGSDGDGLVCPVGKLKSRGASGTSVPDSDAPERREVEKLGPGVPLQGIERRIGWCRALPPSSGPSWDCPALRSIHEAP
jgi:hypothetical protein